MAFGKWLYEYRFLHIEPIFRLASFPDRDPVGGCVGLETRRGLMYSGQLPGNNSSLAKSYILL
jgi:hypothetical protein